MVSGTKEGNSNASSNPDSGESNKGRCIQHRDNVVGGFVIEQIGNAAIPAQPGSSAPTSQVVVGSTVMRVPWSHGVPAVR